MIQVQVAHRGLRFDFDHHKPVQRAMAKDLTNGGYEPATWQAIQTILRPGDHAVDVGAHVGVLTCLMAACVGPTGRVDAFEPEPYNRVRLLRHTVLNNVPYVTIHPQAVSDRSELVTFYRCADNDGGHAVWNPGMVEANTKSRSNPSALTVRTVRLDDVIHGAVRLIKTDTEGHDFAVLRGAEALMAQHHPAVIAEIHRFGLEQCGDSEDALRDWMRTRGYRETLLLDHQPSRAITAKETVLDDVVFNILFEHVAA